MYNIYKEMKKMNHLPMNKKLKHVQQGRGFFDDVGNFFVRDIPNLFTNTIDPWLKKTKVLSKIVGPIAGLAAGAASLNPAVGAIGGTVATAALNSAGYGKRRKHNKIHVNNDMAGRGKCKF